MTCKSILCLGVSLFVFAAPQAFAQHHDIPHDMPMSAPPIPMPNIPVPPSIPTADQFVPPAQTEDLSTQWASTEASLKDQMKILSTHIEELKSEIYKLEYVQKESGKNGFTDAIGYLEEAQMYMDVYKRNLVYEEETKQLYIDRLKTLQEKKAKGEYVSDYEMQSTKERIAQQFENVAYIEQQIAYWTAETGARTSKGDEVAKDLADKKILLASEQKALEKLYKEAADKRKAFEAEFAEQMRANEELMKQAAQESVSAGTIGADDFFGGNESGKSSETPDVAPVKTMQELREDSVRDAFSEMNMLNFQTGFLEKADVAGQVTQTIIGFVPGASGADIALSSARGFAEALGSEIAKGTTWADALEIAAANAGMKGAISIVGNKLTAGADGLANRVAVLSEVGFSKLTTKQISEYGAKGISFLVVKTGQLLAQEATDQTLGKPAVKKVAEWVKEHKNTSTAGSGYGAGYGGSFATQPLVSY